MNDPTPPARACDIPVFGAWCHRSSPEMFAEWDGHVSTPDTITIRPDEYCGFSFHAVSDVTDADAGRLADAVRGVPNFRSLDLSGCERVTNRGFAQFAGMTQIEELKLLGGCALTSDGLKTVPTLTGLRELYLEGFARLTDRGLAFLTGLPKLKYLGLQGCPVTDAALVHVANMPALEILTVAGCRAITDRGLGHLRGHPNLRRVVLNSCWGITDRGLAHLAEVPRLEYVMLSVPSTFLSRLTGRFARLIGKDRNVPNPQGLHSPAGVQRLQAARPNCEVEQMFDYQSLGNG